MVMAMFHERLASEPASSAVFTIEETLFRKMQRVVSDLNGLFGKVMADLIAESQSNPKLLLELHEHICNKAYDPVCSYRTPIRNSWSTCFSARPTTGCSWDSLLSATPMPKLW